MNPILAFQNWYRNASPDKKRKALLIGIGSLATLALFMLTGGNDSTSNPLDASPLYFVGVAVKLIAVLLLIIGGAIIFQRWYGNRLRKGTDRHMHLVESVRLSPKQALHVVEVAGKHYLIGATDSSISMLSPVEMPQEEPEPSTPAQPAISFGDLFTALKQKNSSNSPADPKQPDGQS
jgi:flagellar biosynthetic protein FliO